MYPIVLVTGEKDVAAHYGEILDGLERAGHPVVSCWSASPFQLPIHTLTDEAWSICKLANVVESTMSAIRMYHNSAIILVCAEDERFDNEKIQMAFDGIFQYLTDVADIVFVTGECDVFGVNIENATATAIDMVRMVVGDGV